MIRTTKVLSLGLPNYFQSLNRPSPSGELFGVCQKKQRSLAEFMHIRTYLSPAYPLQEKWNMRLKDKYISSIKPIEFYYDLSKKYRKEKKISAVDADVFLNSIHDQELSGLIDEVEEVVRLLRRSPETVNTLESTPHCIVRHLLTVKNYMLLLKFLSDPTNYGIFLEPYLANLLMDTFLIEKNYMAAARIAALLMLQEDYGPPLTQSFVVLSCFSYIFNFENNVEEWVDYNYVEEPLEEVKVIVKYIRNPYFDDHFDLKDPLHIVGKTLAWLSPLLEEPFKTNAELLGLALFNKWSKLEEALKRLLQSSSRNLLAEKVHSITTAQVEEKCADDEMKTSLQSLLTAANSDLDRNLDILGLIEYHVKEQVKKYEQNDITEQEKRYDNYIITRNESVKKQLEIFERNKLLMEIEAKKKHLKEKEDVIFFFDNKDKIELELFKKRQLYPQVDVEQKAKKEDEEYISPEVKKRHS